MKARRNRFVGQPGAIHAVLYHGSSTPPDQMAQYLKEGWRFKGEGGLYGYGLYTNFKQVPDSKTMRGLYGPWIYKLAARIKDFIVFDPDAAVKIYGPNPPTIADQIRALSPGVKIEPVEESWDGIRQPTSALADRWIRSFRELRDPASMPNGLVYSGDQDKYSAVLFHPENVSILGYRNLHRGETDYTPYRAAGRDWRGELKSDASRVTTGRIKQPTRPIKPIRPGDLKKHVLGLMVPIPGQKYAISKYEVTQRLYLSVMGNNPSGFQGPANPVEVVSWNDAVKFCNKLAELTGLPVRLPTEEEWEYAAKGGEDFEYAGSNNIDEVAWYERNSGGTTHPVGQKKPNGYGLYDMSGNVCEWTSTVAIVGGSNRVYRGGCWNDPPARARVAYRYRSAPGDRYQYLGFRLAMDM